MNYVDRAESREVTKAIYETLRRLRDAGNSFARRCGVQVGITAEDGTYGLQMCIGDENEMTKIDAFGEAENKP